MWCELLPLGELAMRFKKVTENFVYLLRERTILSFRYLFNFLVNVVIDRNSRLALIHIPTSDKSIPQNIMNLNNTTEYDIVC